MVSARVGPASDPSQAAPEPVVRLRTLLGLLLVGWGVATIWPRGHAAWKLHNLAVAHADYAVCMAGATGAAMLLESPDEYLSVVRRRIISAAPEDRPLASCEKLAEKIGVEHLAYRAHAAQAEEFAEYQNRPDARGSYEVTQLAVDLSRIDALAAEAWPFVRSGAATLMKPSTHAKEAPHAPHPPVPGLGSGLPAARFRYRSTAAFGDTVVASLGSGANSRTLVSKNGGVDWAAGGSALVEEVRDRCVADFEGRAFTLSRMTDGRRVVISQGPTDAPQIASLGAPEEDVAGISCDESALVAAMVLPRDETGHHPVVVRICPFARPCRDMESPPMGSARLYFPVDVARLGGDTLVARTSGGITRVTSTRDGGRTWLPWIVAYDHRLNHEAAAAPFRLLVVGDSVLLYSGSRGGERYPLLVSQDHGASFRAPELEGTRPAVGSSDRRAMHSAKR